MTDVEPPPGAILGRPIGLHAVRDEPTKLGDVLRRAFGAEVARVGPATAGWLEKIAARADADGGVHITAEELAAALEADAGNVTRLPLASRPPFAVDLVTDRPPHEDT